MTDRTDTLPPPDYVRHITHGLTHIVGAINYYTADTVRRLLAEARAQEREACARLVETQDTCGDPVQCWLDASAKKIRARGESNG